MLRNILLASAALVAFAGAASAADMPARMPVKAVPFVQAYNWTGFYAGVNLGYGWGRASDDLGLASSMNGVIGGAQIGYNWQLSNNFVFGLETDFQGSGQRQTTTVGAFSASDRVRYFGTVRARAGYAWDRTLLYITGGYAYTNVGVDLSGPLGTATSNTTKSGGTVGAGIEYAFAGPWSAKLEYLYVDTGTQSVTLFGVTDNVRIKNHIARVGVNYRF